ncbi:ABC transporter ATP-binding protein [Alkalihalobacillus sp. CinArs1]|uniref:ABC transporter ATP-binding protein n=1 Tax=Alkalihalobacillus sp. CinArs1 TaxID=2995314 RepID=UPI0022DD4ADC|nr:ABC transporter ATP-binding protein [Alkalihalobacillus sp. CinArs1]
MLNVAIESAGYQDNRKAVRNIAFDVGAGELVGLLGGNGAGKSTTIKALLGLLKGWKGNVEIKDGARYAYIPEQPVLYDYLTFYEHLELAAASSQGGEEWERRAKELIAYFRMEKVVDDYPSSFSKGMKQKVMLITAFMLKADLYIIDEPFLGLDPRATKDFLTLIEIERERGAGILMCTHVLDTAERICDRFILLNDGTLLAQGSLHDFQLTSGEETGSLLDCVDTLLEQER